MSNDRRRVRLMAAPAAALLLVFAATYFALDRTEDRPDWLSIETPAAAVVGRPFEVRVTLKKPVEPAMINCTLHRANAERRGWGYLASGGPSRPAAGGRTYTFVFEVPEREETAFAFPLVFLSPTGKWEDGTRAVTAAYVPVLRNGSAAADPALRRRPLYSYPTAAEAARRREREATGRPRGRPSVWVHPALGALLLVAAALARAKAGRPEAAAGPEKARSRRAWLVVAVLLAASAVVELSGIAGHAATWGRRMAAAGGVYELRKPVQKALMAATAAASLGLFLLFLRAVRRSGSDRHLLGAGIGLAGYLAVSFVSVLSFHAVDVVRGIVWHGISPVDAVRGAGVAAALIAAAFALRTKAGGTPT